MADIQTGNTPAPATDTSNLTVEQRLSAIEQRVDRQDYLHRNVGPDGNIYHYWNVLPMIGAASVISAIAAIFIVRVFKPKN